MKNLQETNNLCDVCKEVLILLSFFNAEVIEKIPIKVFKKLNALAADSKCNYFLNPQKNFEEQDISENAKDLISLLYYTYIVDKDKKNELLDMWNKNEEKYQKELNEKYNVNNLFNKSNNPNFSEEVSIKCNNTTLLIEYKESFFTKFKNFIFKILHIHN